MELDLTLAAFGIARSRLNVLNAIACTPPWGKKSEENMRLAAKACRPLFLGQLTTHTPAIPSITMGKWAFWAASQQEKAIGRARGFVRSTELSTTTIATWHPTFALFRNPWEAGAFDADVKRFGRAIAGKLRPNGKVVLNPSVRTLEALLKEPYLATDIETAPENKAEGWTGKDPTRAKLKIIGFGTEDKAWVLVWSKLSYDKKDMVRRILASTKTVKVLQNGYWFDIRVLRRYGMTVNNVMDVRLMRRAISTTAELSLRHMVSLFDDSDPWKEKSDDDEEDKAQYEGRLRDIAIYNGKDCFKTARVYQALLKEERWKEERVQRLHDIHVKLDKIVAEMHDVGVQVHKRNRNFMIHCLDQEYDEKEKIFLQTVDSPNIKCNPNDMRALIYERHRKKGLPCFGLPDPYDPRAYTDETLETIKVDKSALLTLIASGEAPEKLVPIIDAYWQAEETWKQRSFLVSEKVEHAIGKDGRLRPSFNSCGTDTMRFSCRDPNIMQWDQTVRAMLCAAPGKRLVHMDKSQLELRVMAIITGDEELQRRLDTGDVYSEDAKDWFGLPRDMDVKKLKKAARHQSKIIHLATQYRAGLMAIYAQALAQDRSITFMTVRGLVNGFQRTYPRTIQWWDEEHNRVLRDTYSEGRLLQGRRYYPRKPPVTETANWPIQRTASEMMNLELIELHGRLKREIPSAKIVIQLHDAFDVECWEKDVEQVQQIMTEVSDREYTIEGRTRRFPVEIKVGEDWSEV